MNVIQFTQKIGRSATIELCERDATEYSLLRKLVGLQLIRPGRCLHPKYSLLRKLVGLQPSISTPTPSS